MPPPAGPNASSSGSCLLSVYVPVEVVVSLASSHVTYFLVENEYKKVVQIEGAR